MFFAWQSEYQKAANKLKVNPFVVYTSLLWNLDPVFTDKATYSSEPIATPDGFSPYGFVNMTFEIGKNGTVEIKTLELQHKTYYSVTLAYLMPIIVGLMLGAIGWAILNKKFIK